MNEIFTIGYSTHSREEFIHLLQAHQIKLLIDIRTIPKSRYNPDFNENALKTFLKDYKIDYRHMKDLGGLRRPAKDSKNIGWKNASFRGFADYMQTPSFQKALEKLMKIAQKKRCALMCAEGVYWRCHRSLIADALLLQNWKVYHIQSKKTAKEHVLTSFLHVENGQMVYLE